MSFCDPLTFGDASCLISCHLRFVSNSCHFCSRCIWGPFGMLGLSVCTPSRKDGIASRDSDRSGRCTSAEADRRTGPLRTNVPESGCPRPVSASNSWIIVIIHEYSRHLAPTCVCPRSPVPCRSRATCGTVSHRLASPLNRLLRSTRHAATASCTTTSRSAPMTSCGWTSCLSEAESPCGCSSECVR